MSFEINEVGYNRVLHIRHQVMWPNKPFDFIKLENDKKGKHFGLSVDEKLTSVISLFENNNALQFRKFATLNEYQGQGYGTKLLNYIIDFTKNQNFDSIWCNARVEKTDFYLKFGLKETTIRFKKDGVDYVVMEKMTNAANKT